MHRGNIFSIKGPIRESKKNLKQSANKIHIKLKFLSTVQFLWHTAIKNQSDPRHPPPQILVRQERTIKYYIHPPTDIDM